MVPGLWFGFVVFFQGDACTSCPSLSTAVGDGVAVKGPKGDRGDPGPPGEGKPGRNVRKPCVCSFIYLPLFTVRITDDRLACFLFRENQAYRVCRDLSVPKEARWECSFITFIFVFTNTCRGLCLLMCR